MKKNSGITLLELLVVIGLISTGLLAVTALLTQTLKVGSYNKEKIIATYLAQEGIELVRNIRDYNWIDGKDWYNGLNGVANGGVSYVDSASGNKSKLGDDYSSTYLKKDTDGFYQYNSGDETQFARVINTNYYAPCGIADDCLEVVSKVTWDGGDEEVEITTMFFNWRN